MPPGWSSRIVPAILLRDPVCRLGLPGCAGRSTEVDHIGDKLDHRPANLRGVCHDCHVKRTAQQAADAKPKARRSSEQHPGLL